MTPQIATDIIARDKTAAGFKSAEKRGSAFAQKSSAQAKESGFAKIGKQMEGLAKFGKSGFGFGDATKAVSAFSRAANDFGAYRKIRTEAAAAGAAGEGALAAVGEAGLTAAGSMATAGLAVAGLAVGTYALGEKWAKIGAEVDRTAKSVGMAAMELQKTRAAGERFGVTADATTASVDGLGQAMYDVRSGANNLGVGVLAKYGKQLKYTKDGAVDTYQALLDVSDIVAQQKDPYAQKKVADIFGVGAMLPLLRQGSAAIKAAGADYQGSGAALTDAEVAKSADVYGKTVTLKQHLGAGEKTLGVAAEGATGAAADAMLGLTKELSSGRPLTALVDSARGLAHAGHQAADSLIYGGEKAGRDIANAVRAGGTDLAAKATAFFQAKGFTPAQAQGMTAGAYAESKLNPKAVNPTSGAFGIGQWLGKRKAALFEQYGPNPTFEDQLSFMGWELNNTEHSAGAALRSAPNATAAMQTYVSRFMRPAAGAETIGDFARGDRFLSGKSAPDTAKVHVDITLKGAPAGTVATVSDAPDATANLNIARGMDGP